MERIGLLWDEMTPLLTEHWREIATHQDIILDPIRENYETIDRAGALRVYTVRAPQPFPQLIGYAVYTVAPNPHYRASIQAVQDVLFVANAWRKGSIGTRLIRYADSCLAEDGVQVVVQHVKVAHPRLGRLLELQGYRHVEQIYSKRLDRKG